MRARVYLVVLTIFVVFNKKIRKNPPTGSPIIDATKTLVIGAKEKGLDNAKPSALAAAGHLEKYAIVKEERYTDLYVSQIKNAVLACKVREGIY